MGRSPISIAIERNAMLHSTRTLMLVSGIALALAAGAAHAQSGPTPEITFTIEWQGEVVSPSSPTIKGFVYADLYPDPGTIIYIQGPLPGKGQNGEVKTFASSILDLLNLQNGLTGTLNWTVPPEFGIAGLPGTPDGNGGITGSTAGQFGPPINPNPVITGKAKVLELTWTTSDFTFRNVLFGTNAKSGKVFADVGLPNGAWIGASATILNGQGGFSVIPAPGLLATLCAGVFLAARRRR
jgi:hypothetical protein